MDGTTLKACGRSFWIVPSVSIRWQKKVKVMEQQGIPVDALLRKGDKKYSSLEEAVKKALKTQDPEEYARRYPEESAAGQSRDIVPAKRILAKIDESSMPRRIDFDSWPEPRDQGYTINQAMAGVLAFAFGLPLLVILLVMGKMQIAVWVALGILYLVFKMGQWSEKIKKGWGCNAENSRVPRNTGNRPLRCGRHDRGVYRRDQIGPQN